MSLPSDSSFATRSLVRALALAATAIAAHAQCPQWADGFQAPGTGGPVGAFATITGAGGQTLLVFGGHELRAPELAPTGGPVVTWDGTTLASLGALSPLSTVEDLIVWDDGSGPALYAGGNFVGSGLNGVAQWDGSTWQSLAAGLTGVVHDLEVYDDGSGPALYAAGSFLFAAGGPLPRNVARWDGTAWASVAIGNLTGPNGEVFALTVWDDGTGPKLVAGGSFSLFGTSPGFFAHNLARWSGAGWSALGGGVSGGRVLALATFDEGSGPRLFVGGEFTSSGTSVPSRAIARYDGAAWSTVGAGFGTSNPRVHDLATGDVGPGPRLFATGTGFPGTAQWDGAQWTSLGEGTRGDALEVLDDGTVRALYLGGAFQSVAGVLAHGLARWDGTTWSAVTEGDGGFHVTDATTYDDGSGRTVYLSEDIGPASPVQRWNGSTWTPVGSMTGFGSTLLGHDDGAGVALYAGGNELRIGTVTCTVARWNGTVWSPVGNAASGPFNGVVLDLAEFDDGGGNALYAIGVFDHVDGVPVENVARWDGSTWSALGAGLDAPGNALAVYDDGTGEALYAGGQFASAGGVVASKIARWDGTQWAPVGGGIAAGTRVAVLHPFDDGTRTKLVIGGDFGLAGTLAVQGLAAWDGTAYSGFGTPTPGTLVWAVAAFDAGLGRGRELHVGGTFPSLDGVAVANVARWDGTSWHALDGGVSSASTTAQVLTLEPCDLGQGPSLLVGGRFTSAGDTYSTDVALWTACDEVGRTYCHGDGSASACPCGNVSAPGAREGCATTTGLGGRLRASGSASVANDTLALDGTQMNNNAGALYFQGSSTVLGGNGAPFGNGLRCAGGTVMRLAVVGNVAGTSHYPRAGDPPVATQGAVAQPGRRYYQTWFRDAGTYCTTNTFSLTNAVEIVWAP